MNSLSDYVKKRRAELGLTQLELATRSGLARDFVAQVESGKSKLPIPENRRKLAEGLNVSHLDLLIAAGEITRDEVRLAGVEGVVEPDPVLADLIDQLRRLPLTGERPTAIRGLIQEFRNNDIAWANAREFVKHHAD